MDLYLNSIIFIIIGSLFIIPLIIFKGVSKYAPLLFYLILFISTILRPNLLGIDNENLINDITLKDNWTNESFKYTTIYYITYLIPGTWQKIVGLNLISTLITIFSLKNIFKSIKKENKTKYTILLYMSYTLGIATPLILIHARQYFSFSILFIFLNLYRSKKNYIFYELILSLIVITTHPVYSIFLIFYFICKYFRKSIIYFLKVSNTFTKLFTSLSIFLPFILLYNNIDYFYKYITGSMPGFESYGIQLVLNPDSSLISKLYIFIIIFPILFIIINSRKDNNTNILLSILLTYFIFSIPIIFLEFKLNFLYSINRVKTGLYPAIYILLFHLENFKISKKVMLWGTGFLTILNTFSIYRFFIGL